VARVFKIGCIRSAYNHVAGYDAEEDIRMAIVPLPRQRHIMQDTGSALRFVIPSRKNFLALGFTGFWLILWGFGLFSVTGELIGSLRVNEGVTALIDDRLFTVVWLVIWVMGGGFALLSVLWQFFGKELIAVDNTAI
jgi:hypothetical protein